MKVTTVALSSLVADPANPRTHDERNMAAIFDSLFAHGQVEPLVVQKSSRMIIAGNGRAAAMRRLGWETCDVVLLDVSDEDARALSIRLNRSGELAGWNESVLAQHLQQLDALDSSAGFGFEQSELDALMGSLDELEVVHDEPQSPDVEQTYDDEIPDEVPAQTSLGDKVDLGPHVLHCGECVSVMRDMPDNSVDAIVCDPPYGIGFMGKQWDASVPGDEWARECLRVLKPGAHLIAFAATRTLHRMVVALEDAGFDIRDTLAWVYWQGFPKSLDMSKELDKVAGAQREVVGMHSRPAGSNGNGVAYEMSVRPMPKAVEITAPASAQAKRWAGFGTALKPAFEPAVLARKPLDGTYAENVLKWETGALNIDGCRFAYGDDCWPGPSEELQPQVYSQPRNAKGARGAGGAFDGERREVFVDPSTLGRFPANLYQCPKPSRREREEGCESLPARTGAQAVGQKENAAGLNSPRAGAGRTANEVRNWHPTVKPVRLMRWLVRLVGCQPGSVILDPFVGSGTTMLAAEAEGFHCIGIELDERHCDIVRARLSHVLNGETDEA